MKINQWQRWQLRLMRALFFPFLPRATLSQDKGTVEFVAQEIGERALVTNHNRLPGSFAGSHRERKEIVSVQIHHHKFHVAARREEQLVRSGPFISLDIAHVRSRLQ